MFWVDGYVIIVTMITHRELEDAKTVIEQAIKDGLLHRSETEDLTDEEYIKLADNIDTYDRED